MTTKAAVGPVIWTRVPPSSATTTPATMAVYSPCCGATPAATASASDSGSDTAATAAPARRSARKSAPV